MKTDRRRLRVRPPRRLRGPPGAARRSRSTPTAATSRSSTSSPIPNLYRPRKSRGRAAGPDRRRLSRSRTTTGMMPTWTTGTLVIDDISHYETEKLMEIVQAGHLLRGHQGEVRRPEDGHPLKQLHSYDYGGPYAGLQGRGQLLPRDRPPGEQQGLGPACRPPGRSTPNSRPPTSGNNDYSEKVTPCCCDIHHKEITERIGPDHQSGQDLPADRRHVRGAGHPRLPAAQPRLAGLLLLPPQHADPALQGAGHGRHQFVHRGLLGVRRPGQPAAGDRQHLHGLRSRRDRRPHDLPVGDDRRRHPADHRQGDRTRARSPPASTSSTPTRPSYVGSHVTGFSNMVKAHGQHRPADHAQEDGKVNVIPGWVEPCDMGEIKRLAATVGRGHHPLPRHLRRLERAADRQVHACSRRAA